MLKLRVLVAAENDHRAYGETIGHAMEALRPSLDVVISSTREMDEALALLEPEIVFCIRTEPATPEADTLAWVELSVEPSLATETRVGECRRELGNPTLEHLLAIVDEAEGLVRTKAASRHAT